MDLTVLEFSCMNEQFRIFGTVSFIEFLLNAHAMQANVRNACKMLNRLTRLVCGEKLCEYSSWKKPKLQIPERAVWRFPTECV